MSLPSDYAGTISVDEFTVQLRKADGQRTYVKDLYIIEADATAKTLVVKFGGAYSGSYYLRAISSTYGRLDDNAMTLAVEAYVTSISPSSGSKYGGTLVTITGVNFGTDPYDNPVKIGNTYCLVQTTSATIITCRIADTVEDVSTSSVLVFLKTSEEATCADTICDWSYITPTHNITNITTAYDATSGATQASILGTDLAEPCELWIDGYQ